MSDAEWILDPLEKCLLVVFVCCVTIDAEVTVGKEMFDLSPLCLWWVQNTGLPH